MPVAVGGGAARRLVVEPGERVRAEGRSVHLAGADWLDLAQVNDLVGRSGPWKSNRSLRLVGADPSAVPVGGPSADQTVMPGRIRVVGLWREDVITVEVQSPVSWSRPNQPEPVFALPAPPGGWDVAEQSRHVQRLDELRASGKIVRDGWLRTSDGALILRVAASDADAVERVLAKQLPRRLCVVRSRYTAAQLREVGDMFSAHAREWGFEAWSHEDMNAHCQPYADVVLTRVSSDLAAWADTLPVGLLTLHPAMTPPE